MWGPRDLVSTTKPSVGFSLNFQEKFFAKSSSRPNFPTQKSVHCNSHHLLKGVDKFISTRFMSAGGYSGRPARNSIGHFWISWKSVPGKRQFGTRTLHSYGPTECTSAQLRIILSTACVFSENRLTEGRICLPGVHKIAFALVLWKYDILTVKNASVKLVHYVTESITLSCTRKTRLNAIFSSQGNICYHN
jgi:hypothetical protein